MDRHNYKIKYVPQCPRHIGLVDQYMWKQKDTTAYKCYNGISHPIYDCKGWVNYTLPLEMYPPVNEIHPQIPMTGRLHMNYRGMPQDPRKVADYDQREKFEHSSEDPRLRGMYSRTRGGCGC